MITKIRALGFVFGLLLFWYFPLWAEIGKPVFTYKVVSVSDGDTFIATDGNVSFRVRIAAMDATEKGQPYSKIATYRLKQILMAGNVTINPIGKGQDRYGRVLGAVFVGKEDVALLMIQEGLATYYRPSCRDYPADGNKYNYDPAIYVEAEKQARKLGKNIWSQTEVELPCQYRHRQ
ncbi:MAG: thermonuclease family protein [Deltaproteobacteria bacterium]|nr:thermonuclease family protein [Deltaproteobacteria bacterium]